MKKSNLALIGLPGCGKSTIGRKLARALEYNFIDTDRLIEKQLKKTVGEIFEEFGEEYFRQIEARVVAEVSEMKDSVIATGGGVVLNPLNISCLKNNAVIIYLKRSPKSIMASADLGGRPLLAGNPEKLWDTYRRRRRLYEEYGDFTVDCERSVGQTVELILNRL